jgi:hypothetical protein
MKTKNEKSSSIIKRKIRHWTMSYKEMLISTNILNRKTFCSKDYPRKQVSWM